MPKGTNTFQSVVSSTKKKAIWALVRKIPRGRVMTYGGVAEKLELEGVTARVVGWAMSESPDDVPWWRVVNSKGQCSVDRDRRVKRQQRKLEAEGIEFSPAGTLSLRQYQV